MLFRQNVYTAHYITCNTQNLFQYKYFNNSVNKIIAKWFHTGNQNGDIECHHIANL